MIVIVYYFFFSILVCLFISPLQYASGKLFSWDIDAFHLNLMSGGNPLVSSAYLLFKKRNLFSEFEISPHVFINFMSAIQVGVASVGGRSLVA